MKTIFRLSLFVVLLFSTSCNYTGGMFDKTNFPDINVSTREMNSRLRLTAPRDVNSFKIGDMIWVELDNLSNTDVEIRPDIDIKIYEKTITGWMESKNCVFYPSQVNRLPTKQEDELASTDFNVSLCHQIGTNNSDIRIFIIATVVQNGKPTKTKSGAYVDVVLHP
jgi:hypothetical protein